MILNVEIPEKLLFLFRPMRYKAVLGGRGCIHGDTLIETPGGQVRVADFRGGDVYSYDKEKNKVVVATASRSFRFPPEMLYKYKFSNGQAVVATKKHKFFTGSAWLSGHEVFSSHNRLFAASPPSTNSEPSLLAHTVSARRLTGKAPSFQHRYSLGSRLCGGLLRTCRDTCQDASPLLSDAMQHTSHVLNNVDAQVIGGTSAPCYLPSRRLSSRVVPLSRGGECCEGMGSRIFSKTSGLISASCQVLRRSRQRTNHLWSCKRFSYFAQQIAVSFYSSLAQSPGELLCALRNALLCNFDKNRIPFITSLVNGWNLSPHYTKIDSITQHGVDFFYDLTVAEHHNYFAGGVVHHNSAKSWSFARALLTIGRSKKIRVLCTREVQNSIKDSVYKLLKDQIAMLGMSDHYEVMATEIRGRNGTEFAFSGLSTHTVDSIKSFEGCDVCWVEEGQSVVKRSWDILLPTIRKTGSEVWVTYNPDLETDETHQLFAIHTPKDCIVVRMNYNDNPWLNDVLENERQRCLKYSPDDYDNIWLGKCRPAVAGAIYYKEMESVLDQGRICNLPYDPMLRVHVVFDIGWNDAMSIALVQRHLSEIRIIKYISDSHKTLDYYSAELKELRYNWGKVFLPHDGYNGDVKTGKGCDYVLRKLGWSVPRKDEIIQLGVETGIKHVRMIFPQVYFDKTGCEDVGEQPGLIECLKRYKRSVNLKTDEAGAPVHDKYSHGADCYRYVCVNAELMTNEEEYTPVVIGAASYSPSDVRVGI